MDLHNTGSDELLFIKTKKVCFSIKGKATHPLFQDIEVKEGSSSVKIKCMDEFEMEVREEKVAEFLIKELTGYRGKYAIKPLFFEQQNYEIYIEAQDGCTVEFWHDNINIRNKISRASRIHSSLYGGINFGNEIGYSDFLIQVDGKDYLKITIEVFPTKISYQEDYKAIIADVTREVYNLAFDFLKKTYLGYQQNGKTFSSPVEFFSVINTIFEDFMKALDMILVHPHHVLEKVYEVERVHKVKRTDKRTVKWLEKHSGQAGMVNGKIVANNLLAIKKQITYDTKENRLTKYILKSIIKKLEIFKCGYLRLQREKDEYVLEKLDSMIARLKQRKNTTFLSEVEEEQTSGNISLVFSMAPGYRDLYKYYLMLLHGLSLSGDVFDISIKDLAVLYEYWCFIKLNMLLKERYELVSQDIIKVQGNGLFVTLVKGEEKSKVIYRNPTNGEKIILTYNPAEKNTPTVSQKPDNVLRLEKKGADIDYEYIFDAKYRINPALPGSYYYNKIDQKPGPQEEDINTMHRYRDAIVYSKGTNPYERTMFGAYVLFPYSNAAEYSGHRFFKSIEKVNIGGLPFLPSETKMVSDFIAQLIGDSADSAFERATLPIGIEKKLAKVEWSKHDVLLGLLRSKGQLDVCIKNKFYHIPQNQIDKSKFPIRYIAIYQSRTKFGNDAGIRWYGEVTTTSLVKRKDITEIPAELKNAEKMYYRFEIKEWKQLRVPIKAKEDWPRLNRKYTNFFLLEHSTEVPELWIENEQTYRLYHELKRLLHDTEINDEKKDIEFHFNDKLLVFEGSKIKVYNCQTVLAEYEVKEFIQSPNVVMRKINEVVLEK